MFKTKFFVQAYGCLQVAVREQNYFCCLHLICFADTFFQKHIAKFFAAMFRRYRHFKYFVFVVVSLKNACTPNNNIGVFYQKYKTSAINYIFSGMIENFK